MGEAQGAPPAAITRAGVLGEDAGLEVLVLSVRASEREFASRMNGIAGGMAPMSSELERLWNEHGLRMVAVASGDLPAAIAALSGGGSGSGIGQRQWLGQSPGWVEVVRGPGRGEGAVVALDVERIRLPAGAMRLLARAWLEPVPPTKGAGGDEQGAAPGAVLRIDLVTQHMDDRSAAIQKDPLGVNPKSIAAEDQGLMFRRLLARLSVAGEQAYLIVSERPGVDWARAAREPEPTAEVAAVEGERIAPKVGQVVRGGARGGAAGMSAETSGGASPEAMGAVNREESAGGEWGPMRKAAAAKPEPSGATTEKPAARRPRESRVSGPAAPRVPTVGEAMLGGGGGGGAGGFGGEGVRTVVVLVPRVPREFSLTPGR